MFGNHFYNEGIRRLTIAFGQIFNNIQIQRKNSTGAVTARQKVPLAYASRERYLQRLDQQPDLQNISFATVLPRMSFEMTGLAFDSSRNIQKMNKFKRVKSGTDGKEVMYNYTPVPYNINYSLNIFTATTESGLQIVEQILPYFQPDYTVTINAVPDLNLKRDVPIVFSSLSYSDDNSGRAENRRIISHTLSFEAKTYLFGPLTNQKVIKQTQSDLYTDAPEAEAVEQRIIVVPNPVSADIDDDFGFTTTITNYNDTSAT